MTELKNRGVRDIFIACVDGLKRFPEAIASVFPQTQVQLCVVHMVRHSLKFVSWKDCKAVAADLKAIYTAANSEVAERALAAFSKKWNGKYPTISESWHRNWQGVIPFLAYPDCIRKAIYTTNAIESIQRGFRKVTRNRGAFPNDDSIMKLLYLALRNMEKSGQNLFGIRKWPSTSSQSSSATVCRWRCEHHLNKRSLTQRFWQTLCAR